MKASIDNCGNCLYWGNADFPRNPGMRLCDIVTNPEKYYNGSAYTVLELGGSRGTRQAAAVFVSGAGFHCTLYKVKP